MLSFSTVVNKNIKKELKHIYNISGSETQYLCFTEKLE